MMTWVVVARDPSPTGQEYRMRAVTRGQVAELLVDQRARGRDAHIEDANGRRVDDTAFKTK
jgi:hypothetical protein